MKLDGREIAANLLQKLAKDVAELKQQNTIPQLVVILIGDDPASMAYVRQKEKKAQEMGAKATVIGLDSLTTDLDVLDYIKKFNIDPTVHGIIVQRPVPKHINGDQLDSAVLPEKDVDSFHPKSPYPMPLAQAVVKILENVFQKETQGDFSSWLKSKQITVIGKGKTGGGPTIALLQKMGCTVTVVDSKTPNTPEILQKSDIVVSAIGKANTVDAKNLKQGCIVIQVGMHRGEDGKLHGDFDENILEEKAAYYTPVPGGIGPVNVACLLENVINAAKKTTGVA